MDGLVGNDALKMKILRDNPDTLQGGIATATKEQYLRARAYLSLHYHSPYKSDRKEEPMVIDNYRPLRCFKCKKQVIRLKHLGMYTCYMMQIVKIQI